MSCLWAKTDCIFWRSQQTWCGGSEKIGTQIILMISRDLVTKMFNNIRPIFSVAGYTQDQQAPRSRRTSPKTSINANQVACSTWTPTSFQWRPNYSQNSSPARNRTSPKSTQTSATSIKHPRWRPTSQKSSKSLSGTRHRTYSKSTQKFTNQIHTTQLLG